ncbi:hypothetical protein HYH03_004199 [Edaphochlamys debaryana]|uniref:RAP domain-containing protein n=1 Tax=Edaphochlamys debaryana TaxID=47281 RepID=A0A836C3M5_9CHLO|nr:hypothetical protein HYH03_004199 [Edaphochlamys debaryana]|eukprot:KAG2497937.1 hypothetical protein HYH03_004199 [Edaphochlamys debaryana]
MTCAAKLHEQTGKTPEDTALCHGILATLAEAALPLLARPGTAADLLVPLTACAEADYWRDGYALELLQRLSADDWALVKAAARYRDDPKQRTKFDQLLSTVWQCIEGAASAGLYSRSERQSLRDATAPLLLEAEDLDLTTCADILVECARHWLSGVDRMAHHLTARLIDDAGKADVQHLANSLAALGELAEDVGHKPRPEDLKGLAREVVARLSSAEGRERLIPQMTLTLGQDTFEPEALVSMLRACVRLRCTEQALVEPLVLAAGKAAPRLRPRDLADMLRALELLPPSARARRLIAKWLGAECMGRRLTGFTTPDVCKAVWGLSTSGVVAMGKYLDLYPALVDVAVTEAMQGVTSQNWADLWYGLALVLNRPTSRRLLELTAQAAGALRDGAEPQECANLLWALAILRLYDERLVDALAGRLGELLRQDPDQAKAQELCNSLWALAVVGPGVLSRHSGLVEGLLREAVRRWEAEGSSALAHQELRQLWQVQLELEAMGSGNGLRGILGASRGSSGSLLSRARGAAAAREHAGLQAHQARRLADALRRWRKRGLEPRVLMAVQPGFEVEGLGRVADVVGALAGGRRVDLMPNGPAQCFSNRHRDAEAVNGSTLLRNRQLERVFGRGNVLSVSYWEWKEVTGNRKWAYLRRQLGLEAE